MATITGPGLTQIAPPSTYTQGASRLTSVFPVQQGDPHQIWSSVTWEVDACGIDFDEVDFNSYADCIRTAEKTFDEGLLFAESFPVGTLYAALKCRPGAIGGGSQSDYEARATRRLQRLESTFLESKLEAKVLADGTEVAAGADLYASIGALLAQATQFNSPTIHLPIGVAFQVGQRLQTLSLIDLNIVVSPAYSPGTVFLTSAVSIWGSATTVNNVPDVTNNYIMAIAERQYGMGYECEPYYTVVEGS